MVVEPFASDKTEENLNPVGRTFSRGEHDDLRPRLAGVQGPALGAQAGPRRLKKTIGKGGFKTLRVATTTPFNLILEARV